MAKDIREVLRAMVGRGIITTFTLPSRGMVTGKSLNSADYPVFCIVGIRSMLEELMERADSDFDSTLASLKDPYLKGFVEAYGTLK